MPVSRIDAHANHMPCMLPHPGPCAAAWLQGVKYGLQQRGPKAGKPAVAAPSRKLAAFGGDSDSDEDNVNAQVARQANKKRSDAKVCCLEAGSAPGGGGKGEWVQQGKGARNRGAGGCLLASAPIRCITAQCADPITAGHTPCRCKRSMHRR